MKNGDNGDQSLELTIVDEALAFLKQLSNDKSESIDWASTSGATKSTEEQYAIELTKRKIKQCSQFLETLNTHRNSETGELSYEEALLLIYFLETFALQGSGDKNIKTSLEDYFSPYYYAKKDLKMCSDLRSRLLKHSSRTLDLKDVAKLIKVDISHFFIELQKFVEHVQTGLDRGNPLKSDYALDKFLVDPRGDLGKHIDVESFLAKELKKLLEQAFGGEQMTWKDLFDFIVNYYPIFKDATEWGSKELSDLRNKLMHQFHKYGRAEFGNEIFAMKHELLRYHSAQKVYKVVCNIEPDDESKEITERLDEQTIYLEQNEPARTEGLGAEKGFCGYKFSKSMLPDEVTNFEELAERYLKFKFLTHNFVDGKSEEEEGDGFMVLRKKLCDSDKREWFEEFDKLESLRTDNSGEYIGRKNRFAEISLKKYGVRECHFDEAYKVFEKNGGDFVGSDETKDIANILNTLKDIRKENPKLSNHVVVSLYDRFVARKPFFDRLQNPKAAEQVANEQIQGKIREKLEKLPSDRRIMLQIKNKVLFVSTGEVIKGMLNLFCNAYDTYRVEFELKDVFNDNTILEYMVRQEVEEVDVEQLVDSFFKFIVTFDRESVGLPRREKLIEKFLHLKRLPNKLSNRLYNDKKDALRIELEKCGVEESTFNVVCQRYVEGNEELPDDEKEKVKKVRGIIGDLKKLHKELAPYQKISSWYQRLVGGVALSDYANEKNLLDGKTPNEKKFIKSSLETFLKHEPHDNEQLHSAIKKEFPELCKEEVDKCARLSNGKRNDKLKEQTELFRGKSKSEELQIMNTLKELYDATNFEKAKLAVGRWGILVGGILQTFGDKLQLKVHNYMRIKKLMNIKYAAPYVVRLMTKVGNVNIIEIEDLKKLIGILLNEDYSYVKYLNDLLSIDSRKLNPYEEVCTQIMRPSFNIENMLVVFNEPKHVNGILTALNGVIHSSNASRDETDKLTNTILQLLNSVVLEFICYNEEDAAMEILDGKLKEIFERLRNDNKIRINDPIHVNYQSNLVRVKNAQGKKKKQRALHKEALEILEKVRVNDDGYNYIQLLLVRCHKAYTLKLLKRYDESHQEYKRLFEKIVKFALDKDVSDVYNIDGIYGEIEKSAKYCQLRDSSEETQRYLDILDIGYNIAHTLLCHTVTKQAHRDTFVKNCEDSLKVYSELYRYTLMKFGIEHQDTMRIMRQLASAYNRTVQKITKHLESSPNRVEDYQKTMQYLRDALAVKNVILEIQLKTDNNYHTRFRELSTNSLMMDIHGIAAVCIKLGNELPRNDPGTVSNYQKALDVDKKIYDFQKRNKSDEGNKLKTIRYILCALDKLCLALPENDWRKVSYYEEAVYFNEIIYDLQKRMNGTEYDESTFKTVRSIAWTLAQLGSCELLIQKQRLSYCREALKKYEEAHEIAKKIFVPEHKYRFESLAVVIYTHLDLHSRLHSLITSDVALEHHSRSLQPYKDLIDILMNEITLLHNLRGLRE